MAADEDAIETSCRADGADVARALIAQLVEATRDYELLSPESAAGLGL